VLPILRQALPDASVVSFVPDVDQRTYPLVLVTRAGGTRHETRPRQFGLPVIELEVIHDLGLVDAEKLYEDVLDALYNAVRQQITVEGVGYLHSLLERQGATSGPSPFPDTWLVRGVVQLGLRPHEKSDTPRWVVPPLT
jgi:hypothetical protein